MKMPKKAGKFQKIYIPSDASKSTCEVRELAMLLAEILYLWREFTNSPIK